METFMYIEPDSREYTNRRLEPTLTAGPDRGNVPASAHPPASADRPPGKTAFHQWKMPCCISTELKYHSAIFYDKCEMIQLSNFVEKKTPHKYSLQLNKINLKMK